MTGPGAIWGSERSLTALAVLLMLAIFILPALELAGLASGIVLEIFLTLGLLAGVVSAGRRSSTLYAAGLLVPATILVRWGNRLLAAPSLDVWEALLSLASTGLLAVVVFAEVFRQGRVSVHRIMGAVGVYLLAGMTWANAYVLLSYFHPGAFEYQGDFDPRVLYGYFSFVTLTTVGYGDVIPVHPIARSLAVTEALFGQLYPAILIARLVSLQLTSRPPGNDSEPPP